MQARLEYAERGWWTLPAPADGLKKSLKWACEKTNHVNWGATLDPEVIRREFRSRRLRDQNIGIVTGVESGVFVIEVDTAEHGVDGAAALKAWEKKNGALPDTLKARSPSGSVHRFFNHPGEGTKIKSFTAIFGEGSGVDCKADGGMVLGAPSHRPAKPGKAGGTYEWINAGHAIADAPQALLDVIIEKKPTLVEPTGKRQVLEQARAYIDFGNEAGSGKREWAKMAMESECEILASTAEGSRNHQLNTSAFNLGQIVARGALDESEVRDALMAAAEANGSIADDGINVCEKSFKSGMNKGKLKPRTAPPRETLNDETVAIKAAADDAKQAMPGKDTNVGVGLADFYALMPSHDYIFVPSRETWPASSVNSRIRPIPLKKKNGKPELDEKGEQVLLRASTWLDQNRPVEMMT